MDVVPPQRVRKMAMADEIAHSGADCPIPDSRTKPGRVVHCSRLQLRREAAVKVGSHARPANWRRETWRQCAGRVIVSTVEAGLYKQHLTR